MKMREKIKRFWTMDVHNHEGFTLVELIIVIAILAILSSVAVVGYSSYIEKANKSADEALLYEINLAFQSACAENGLAPTDIDDGKASFDVDTMTLTAVEHSAEADIIASFIDFFKVNGQFKVYESLKWENGKFVGKTGVVLNSVWSALLGTFSSEDIEKFNLSAFMTADELGPEGLMLKVDSVTELAAALAGRSDAFLELLGSGTYMENLIDFMGYDPNDEDEAKLGNDAWLAMVAAKKEQLRADGFEGDDTALENAAIQQLLANNAVLVAAKNTNQNADELLATIRAGFDADDLQDLMNDSTGVGLSNAAAAYAMYTAYAYSLPEGAAREAAIANTNDISTVLNAINSDDPGWQAYLNNTDGQAAEDLAGYLAAMNMINGSVGGEAAQDVLLNGFDNEQLIALLQQSTDGN